MVVRSLPAAAVRFFVERTWSVSYVPPTFSQLSRAERELFGGDTSLYGRLKPTQKATVLLLVRRLQKTGVVDLTGLRLENPETEVRPNRLLLKITPELVGSFKSNVLQLIGQGVYQADSASPLIHKGRTLFSARERMPHYSIHIGMGPEGGFVHFDNHNPYSHIGLKGDVEEYLLHACVDLPQDFAEAIPLRFVPGPLQAPSPFEVAKHLGIDLGPAPSVKY